MHFMPQTGSRYTAAKGCQHQLPPVEGEHEGWWSDLPHTISPVILLPLCCPFQLQTLTSIHLDLSLRSLTTVSLNFPLSLVFNPQASGCCPFPYFHITFNPLVFLCRSLLAQPQFTWGLVVSSTTQTASGQLGSWKGDAKSWGSINVFLGQLGHLRSCPKEQDTTRLSRYIQWEYFSVSPHYQGIRSWCREMKEVKLVGKGRYRNTLLRCPKRGVGFEAAHCLRTSGLEVPPLYSGLPQPKASAPNHAETGKHWQQQSPKSWESGGTSTGRLNTIGNMAIAPRVDYITQCLF